MPATSVIGVLKGLGGLKLLFPWKPCCWGSFVTANLQYPVVGQGVSFLYFSPSGSDGIVYPFELLASFLLICQRPE
nr:hypothetical protein [uncultured Desulfobulbus sp.]